MKKKADTCGSCGCGGATDESTEEKCTQTCGSCDVEFKVSEDARFATLLMLVPMLTLSAFSMMGLL